jgi:4-hydroxy-tetrahydrodipicolinate synthase
MSSDVPSTAPSSPVCRGAGVALVTLFDSDGALLVSQTAELAAAIVAAGATSVLVGGTVGEYYTLDDEERVSVMKAVRAAVPSGVPVIAHVGGVSEERTAVLTKAAVAVGADALIGLPRDIADVRGYYDRLVETSEGVPVLAYHLPAARAVVPVEDLDDLGVVGIKDSAADAARFAAEIITTGVDVYTGSAFLLGLAHDLGATGALLGLSNGHPELGVRAFGGDSVAQLELALMSVKVSRDFPGQIKRFAAERWGVSAAARTPPGMSIAQLVATPA